MLLLAIDFLGEWVESRDCFTWISKSRETVPIVVNNEVTFSELVEKIITRCSVNHDPNNLCITYMLSICSKQKSHPCRIKNDDDLLIYLADVDGAGNRPTLRVYLDDRSVEVSNINVMPNHGRSYDCSSNGWDDIGDQEPFNMEMSENEGGEGEPEREEDEAEDDVVKEDNVELTPNPIIGSNDVFVGSNDVNNVQATPNSLDGEDDGTGFYKGLTFKNKRALVVALKIAALKKHFCFKSVKHTKTVYCVRCVNVNCKWWLRATKYLNDDTFMIKVYRNKHTCGLEHLSSHHPLASAEVVGEFMKSWYDEGKGPTTKKIRQVVNRDLGSNISYWKSRMGGIIAKSLTRGSPEHGYEVLDVYRYMLRTSNEGTKTTLEVDRDGNFLYFFVSLGSWIRGFAFMRKVIAVDGTHLSGKYGGVLLSAVAQDAETHIFPLAFCVVNVECDASYEFFFEQLVGILPSDNELCIISDRHPSIVKAVSKIFPEANYGVCKWHLSQSIRTKFHCGTFMGNFHAAADSYTEKEFESHFGEIRTKCDKAAAYLERVGFERWSRAYFTGNRFGVMTTNIVESMNSMLKDEREMPITALFNAIIRNFSEKFHERRTMFMNHTKPCVPLIEDILKKNNDAGARLLVVTNGTDMYSIGTGDDAVNINLSERTCSCRKFQIDMYPCVHACAAIRRQYGAYGSELYNFTSPYYYTNTYILAYADIIRPILPEELWNAPPELYERKIRPPYVKIPRGRRRTKRMPSVGEAFKSRRNRCGICKRFGHKKTTCPHRGVQSAV